MPGKGDRNMCLAVPARVIAIEDGVARVDMNGNRTRCYIDVVPEVQVGDYVLMHAGYALHVLREDDARETLRLLREAHGEDDPHAAPGSRVGTQDSEGDQEQS